MWKFNRIHLSIALVFALRGTVHAQEGGASGSQCASNDECAETEFCDLAPRWDCPNGKPSNRCMSSETREECVDRIDAEYEETCERVDYTPVCVSKTGTGGSANGAAGESGDGDGADDGGGCSVSLTGSNAGLFGAVLLILAGMALRRRRLA